MGGIRILGEWAHQYKEMTDGHTEEETGHWDIDRLMADFNDLFLDCGDGYRSDYETLIPKFKECVANEAYDKALEVGKEIQSLIVKVVQHKYPDL
jgi:hypothetical protein